MNTLTLALASFATFGLALFSDVITSFAEQQSAVVITNARTFRPKTPAEVKTVEDTMAAVITVTKELGLPVVDPVYLHLYKTTEDFSNVHSYWGRISPTVVRFATAVAEEHRFHVNLERTRGRPRGELVRIFAHEYAHNIEYVYSTINRAPQWIREGFADWVASKVMDNLGWDDYSTMVHRAKLEVGRQTGSLPALSEIERPDRWAVWATNTNGSILTYRYAFLAIDKLMAKASIAEMGRFFADQDFPTHFGVSWNDFYKEVKKSVEESPPVSNAGGTAEKPELKIGQQWKYAWRLAGRQGSVTRQVINENIFENIPVYVFRNGTVEAYYSKDRLALLATASKGNISTKLDGAHEYFSWPLFPRKEWKTSFVTQNVTTKAQQKLSYVKQVTTDVDVPAGTFQTFKIDTYNFSNGALLAEQWYAPQLGWFAKARTYSTAGVREETLMSYQSK